MNKLSLTLGALAVVAVLVPAVASAQTVTATVTTSAHVASTTVSANNETTAKARGDQEITRRLTNLNALSARVAQMSKIAAGDKSTLQASITAEVTTLTNLKAQIDAETNLTNLKTEIQSITKGYRVYLLVLPQGRIEASADRVEYIVGEMQALAPMLQARITADSSSNAATLQAAYNDMTAKIADANAQASAAVTEIANLQPDNGNTTVQASNTAALKDAHNKIGVATKDLVAARADIAMIVKGVKGTGPKSTATTTVSASATAQ